MDVLRSELRALFKGLVSPFTKRLLVKLVHATNDVQSRDVMRREREARGRRWEERLWQMGSGKRERQRRDPDPAPVRRLGMKTVLTRGRAASVGSPHATVESPSTQPKIDRGSLHDRGVGRVSGKRRGASGFPRPRRIAAAFVREGRRALRPDTIARGAATIVREDIMLDGGDVQSAQACQNSRPLARHQAQSLRSAVRPDDGKERSSWHRCGRAPKLAAHELAKQLRVDSLFA